MGTGGANDLKACLQYWVIEPHLQRGFRGNLTSSSSSGRGGGGGGGGNADTVPGYSGQEEVLGAVEGGGGGVCVCVRLYITYATCS